MSRNHSIPPNLYTFRILTLEVLRRLKQEAKDAEGVHCGTHDPGRIARGLLRTKETRGKPSEEVTRYIASLSGLMLCLWSAF